jgi:16S rRNA processing protein RimM
MSGDGLLLAGRVGAPHGLDGSFHVVVGVPAFLLDGALVDIDGRAYVINRRAGHDQRVIIRLGGVEDRNGAIALRGRELRVPRTAASALGEDEWWAEDLEGCAVHDGEHLVGVVERLGALPSCEVLEVRREGRKDPLLVPLVSDAVRSVDIAAKRIDINLAFLGED